MPVPVAVAVVAVWFFWLDPIHTASKSETPGVRQVAGTKPTLFHFILTFNLDLASASDVMRNLPIPPIQWMPMGMVAIKWVTRAMIALLNFNYAYAR